VYAVAKYKFSISLVGIHHMDMEPGYGIYRGVSPYPDDHVRISQSIIAAFGAIEDLGLDVPAGHGKPSRIGDQWNPPVKADLDLRLARAGVGGAETLLWTVRGPARRLERRRPLPSGSRPSWAWGPVRDIQIPVADAIAYASWLRDRVASHNVKDLTPSLSPYDAVNVQHLARFLILVSTDFRVWRPDSLRYPRGRLVWVPSTKLPSP